MDEIHTPDSSRYFYADTYDELQLRGKPQRQLSKEFVRKWLIENGFMGKPGQQVPEMSDAFVNNITDRYIELYEKITGKHFHRNEEQLSLPHIEAIILEKLKTLH
jgi:phosphoribosylaminoimidazole-succinocarboxamide synthase